LVDLSMPEVEVRTTPRNIPEGITIDVSAMTMDTVIRVEDVELPDGVEAAGDPDSPVVTVLTMRAVVEDEPAAEGEELEGEEGEGAEGEGDADGEGGDGE
ncbi:MAG: 50S ribosomal protein L25, partial [Actinomycetota bacterium]